MIGVKCEEIGRQSDLYLDGQMEKPEAEAFKKHLATCRSCAALLANRAALRVRMRSVARNVKIPAQLKERIRSSVSREVEREGERGNRSWLTLSSPRALLASAAVVLAAAAGFYYRPAREAPPAHAETQAEFIARISDAVPPVMRVGLAQHVHCGVFRDYPAAPPKLIDLAREEGFSPALINAVEGHVPEGTHVVMAHRCSYNGRNFTHIIARGDNHLMSLLITPRDAGEAFETSLKAVAGELNTPIFASGSGIFSVDAFETPEYMVYLVSDFDPAVNLKAMKQMTPGLRAALL